MSRAPLPITHEDVGAAVYRTIPPYPVSWRRRIFWWIVLRALRSSTVRRMMVRRFGPAR